MVDVVRRTAEQVFIPLTVGGGVRKVEDFDVLLRAGADKVGVNTAAIADPDLLDAGRAAVRHRSASCSASTRGGPRGTASGFEITTHGGRKGTGIDAIAWAAQRRAAGGRGDPAQQHGRRRHHLADSTPN